MANTTNLNLVKPAGTDYALVSVINGNMDIIDSKVGAIPANESAQSQITALNNQMTIDLGSVSGANLNEFVANASLAYIALNYKDKPHPVRVVWTNHDNYQGTMLATTNWVKFSLSTTNDLIYGNYAISGGTVTVGQMGKQINQIAYTNSATVTFSVPSNSRYLFIATAADAPNWGLVSLVSADTSGNVSQLEIKKGGGISSVSTSVANRYTVTYPSSINRHYYCVPLNDAGNMTLVT